MAYQLVNLNFMELGTVRLTLLNHSLVIGLEPSSQGSHL